MLHEKKKGNEKVVQKYLMCQYSFYKCVFYIETPQVVRDHFLKKELHLPCLGRYLAARVIAKRKMIMMILEAVMTL